MKERTYSEVIKNIVANEKIIGIYQYKIFGLSVWRIFRSRILDKHLKKKYGYNQRDTIKKRISILRISINYIKSFFSIVNILRKKSNNIRNVIFSFPRLQKYHQKYIDKFTDPIILNSNLSKSCAVLQRHLAGNHFKPRFNADITFYTDFLEYTSILVSILILPFILIKYFNVVFKIFRCGKSHFQLTIADLLQFLYKLSRFVSSNLLYKILFHRLKPKNVFLVNREINYPIIAACKKLGIITYELQHGVTRDYTILYSGKHDNKIDPDFFLVFGSNWIGKQFGIPVDQIINIGWAYGQFLKDSNTHRSEYLNTALIVSDPVLSSFILNASCLLASEYPNFNFHIRLHPQEGLSLIDKEKLAKYSNIIISDNKIESSLALIPYKYVIGVNSSVIYEALSLGKRVARIAFSGCSPHAVPEEYYDIFTDLNSTDDFKNFINSDETHIFETHFYSSFNKELLNKIIE